MVAFKLKKIVGMYNCSMQFIKIISHYKKRLVLTVMYCDTLHAWWSTQLWLTTLLSSFFFLSLLARSYLSITHCSSAVLTSVGFDLKTYLVDERVGLDVVS